MDILVKIIVRYDILLVQEIVDTSEKAIKQLLENVNDAIEEDSGKYELITSPRIGRNKAKEQYAFFYKKSRFQIKKSLLYDDPGERTIYRDRVCSRQ